jgi:POT family proton-dependent oligopeptide transporter
MATTAPAYRTHPSAATGMPPGIPYIVGNEAAERFSFYGMKSILVVFMTQHLLSSMGGPDFMNEIESRKWLHLFVASAYFFPVIGGILADAFLGKYLTILLLSLVYCAGHLCLALMDMPQPLLAATLEPRGWLLAGLALIGWFYFAINFGSFFSTLLTPWLLEHYGAGWAFGVPGLLMAVATLVFWLGRHRFVHVPPRGPAYFAETFGDEGLAAIARLVPLYLLVAVFWSLYDQTGSAWVQQAERMDRRFLGYEWLPSQIQAINPLLVLLFIPLFGLVLYPAVGRVVAFTPLRRILAGFVLTVAAFAISATAQGLIDAESARLTAAGLGPEAARWPSVAWQLAAYVVITAAEILVSITCLEFSYTQAPPQMKSFVMSLYLLSVSLGNQFTAAVNWLIEIAGGTSTLTGASYYWFFTGCMTLATLLLVPVVLWTKPREYLQAEADAPAS